MSPAEDVLALARRLATGPNLTNLNERLHLLLTATPDNVKRDNMSHQPNGLPYLDLTEEESALGRHLAHRVVEGIKDRTELRAVTTGVTPVATLGPHDYSNPGGAGLVIDRDGRLEVSWSDRSAHVAITPDVVEGFVKQVNKLRADVAKWKARAETAEEFASDLADWSNAIATRVPESYEGSEGTQEACIGTWLDDLQELVTQTAGLVGEDGAFQQVIDADEGVLPIATATIDVTVLEQFRALVGKIHGDDL